MPIRVICPSCNSPVSAPDHLAGKQAPCPHCRGPIVLPGQGPDPLDFSLPDPPFSAPANASGPLPVTSFEDEPRRLSEPWFIVFAELFANIAGAIGLGLVFVEFLLKLAIANRAEPADHSIIVLGLFISFVIRMCIILFCWAILLIFVDIARSLRILCRQGERR